MSKSNKNKLAPKPQGECCPIDEINVADFAPAGRARLKSKADNVTEALGASTPQITPAAEAEYVSPSQPLAEKPKARKPRAGRSVSTRPASRPEREQRLEEGAEH